MELHRAMNGPREKNVYEVSVLTRRKSWVPNNKVQKHTNRKYYQNKMIRVSVNESYGKVKARIRVKVRFKVRSGLVWGNFRVRLDWG